MSLPMYTNVLISINFPFFVAEVYKAIERANRRTDGRTSGWKDGRTDGQTDGRRASDGGRMKNMLEKRAEAVSSVLRWL